jgi:3',5'-cyclic AMP phosphodiesterase CpdA
MKIAHLSDLHVLAIAGVPLWRLLTNKRLTGYANILAGRGRKHRIEVVRALARDLANLHVDHVAVTGDLSNLALDPEFEAARELLETELGLSPDSVSLVPGNHDRYTKGSHLARRFESHFHAYLRSDLQVPGIGGDEHFPVVKLRGPAAIVGLATGVPRLPFVAAGCVGAAQLQALGWILDQPQVRNRTLVLLTHHPIIDHRKGIHALLEGLRDGEALRIKLSGCRLGLALHGHLHRRILRIVPTSAGEIWSVGATSASLVHAGNTRMAGYNLYEISDDGQQIHVSARVLDRQSWTFDEAPVPIVRG